MTHWLQDKMHLTNINIENFQHDTLTMFLSCYIKFISFLFLFSLYRRGPLHLKRHHAFHPCLSWALWGLAKKTHESLNHYQIAGLFMCTHICHIYIVIYIYIYCRIYENVLCIYMYVYQCNMCIYTYILYIYMQTNYTYVYASDTHLSHTSYFIFGPTVKFSWENRGRVVSLVSLAQTRGGTVFKVAQIFFINYLLGL